ncbi:hypothetical protein DS831_06050 [Bombilactobacillus bombi]|uniref:Phage portal protein n=1 Tax=Bombilactobacillus bombi TaxID=1303590 RepID=A0A417ZEM0_9LACO|nr:hypothetical protein [Bombilactobacillus bombi]RHW49722.1 hypothetical protein DS831_06050 [Bombilactobacillus bombi]
MAYGNVEDFLMEKVGSPVQKEKVKFPRFKSPFVIQSLTAEKLDDLQKQATRRVMNKKTHQAVPETDQNKLTDLMMVNSVIFPDLNDERLQKSWGVVANPAGVLKKMLSAGEYAELGEHVQALSGFDINDINSLSETAKN